MSKRSPSFHCFVGLSFSFLNSVVSACTFTSAKADILVLFNLNGNFRGFGSLCSNLDANLASLVSQKDGTLHRNAYIY